MSKLFERLTKKRGITADFLHPEYEKLADPLLLPGMKEGVDRIIKAVDGGEKVLIYGDYDVDGVTASTVMAEALETAGAKGVEIMLPDRFADGYGMSPKVVKKAKNGGFSLVVTVDCGSANFEIIDELTELGIDTVVTDHHECKDELPKAVAVINPKRKDHEGFRDLAGVAIAFKVAQALVLRGKIPAGQEKWLLDLVLIGTICDDMPLTGENRILGYFGMKVLEKTRRVGLIELMKNAGLKKINSESIGFQIGPRLNAAGRIESAELALKLVRSKSRVEAVALANQLEELNKKRRVEQKAATREIEERGLSDEPVIVEVGNWHEGILGIVAGRLTEEYRKPSFVLTEVADGMLKGSGRSFGEFNLAEALTAVADTIVAGGGHAGAAGVRVEKAKLDEFRTALNNYYKSLDLKNQEKFLAVQADLDVSELGDFSRDFIGELALLEPFGEGNEEPIFELKEVEVVEARRMGAELNHLSLLVRGSDGKMLRLVAFYAPEAWFRLSAGERANILIRVLENEWNGTVSVEGRILDIL